MISLLVTLTIFVMLGMIVFQTIYVLDYQNFLAAPSGSKSKTKNKTNLRPPTDSPPASAIKKDHVDSTSPVGYAPKAAIVLCLKGTDPSLEECLTGLISQNYPDFKLHIVIHSPTDPANAAVQEFFSTLRLQPEIQYLKPFDGKCSLKCAAIAQATESLAADVEVVAFVDGDTIVDQHWLADLVTPLQDVTVGATTGNRWYRPERSHWGALVRMIWNAAAVVQMQRYVIAWGGSLAIRTSVIKQCKLIQQWRTAFCEDTLLTSSLKKHKLTLHRVPHLIVENRETVSLLQSFHWISRQLLTVRLHHRAWPMVLLHAIATGIGSIVAPALAIVLFVSGSLDDAGMLIPVIIVYQFVNLVLLRLIECCNRQTIDSRESYASLPIPRSWSRLKYVAAVLVTQVVQPLAVWQANSMEKVKWRGAKYAVKNSRTIKLIRFSENDKLPEPVALTSPGEQKK